MDHHRMAPGSSCNIVHSVEEDAGALILFTSPTLTGKLINLMPVDSDAAPVSSVVRERDLPQGLSFVAVYPRLRRGIYSIEGSDQKVAIESGRVSTLDYVEDCCRIYYHPPLPEEYGARNSILSSFVPSLTGLGTPSNVEKRELDKDNVRPMIGSSDPTK